MSKTTMTARTTVQWAIWGKEPRGTKYKILDCSDGSLRSHDFEEIMTRYPVGAQGGARAVTVSRFGHGTAAHLGLSIQDPAGGVDWAGRPAVETRYYAVPFAHLTQVPVSYEDMYEHFKSCRLRGGTFEIQFPALNCDAIARSMTPHEMRTCALLMTNKRVCIVGAQSASMEDRLGYIDRVASLLPYGMRPQFTASTWTSSTADHRFRLYFAGESRGDGYTVDWSSQDTALPVGAGEPAFWYLTLLNRQASVADLVERLSRAPIEISFEQPDRRAIMSIVEGDSRAPASPPPPTVPVVPPRPQSIAEALTDLAAALRHKDHGRVEALAGQLEDAPVTTEEERLRYQEIIKENGLLLAGVPANLETTVRMFTVVLRVAFPPDLRPKDLPRIEELAAPLHVALRGVLERDSPSIRLVISEQLGHEAAIATMKELSLAEMVDLAARWRIPPKTLDTLCMYLCTRYPGKELRATLLEYKFLTAALQRTLKNPQRQYELLVELLKASYGAEMGFGELAEVVREWFGDSALWGVWQAACMHLYGGDGFVALSTLLLGAPIEESGLNRGAKNEAIDKIPITPPTRRSWTRPFRKPGKPGKRGDRRSPGADQETQPAAEHRPVHENELTEQGIAGRQAAGPPWSSDTFNKVMVAALIVLVFIALFVGFVRLFNR